jgi:hypothetical protein
MTAGDTLVYCEGCLSTARVDLDYCTAHGWPNCCGQTMQLAHTHSDVDDVVGRRFQPARETLARLREAQRDA